MARAVDHHHVEEALESGTAEAVLMLTTSATTDQDALPITVKQAYKAAEENSGSTSPVSYSSSKKKVPLTENGFGMMIYGNGSLTDSTSTYETLKKLVSQNKVVVLRGLPTDAQTTEAWRKLCHKLGIVVSMNNHERSPHSEIFRMSNDPQEGLSLPVASDPHTDGLKRVRPVRYTTLQCIKAPNPELNLGHTHFVPSHEFFISQPVDIQSHWNSIIFKLKANVPVGKYNSEAEQEGIYPEDTEFIDECHMVNYHPERKSEFQICLETPGECAAVISIEEDGEMVELDKDAFLADVHAKFDKGLKALGYTHEWQTGDIVIFDNGACIHQVDRALYAENSCKTVNEANRRIMQRITICGDKKRKPANPMLAKLFASAIK
jgi:alpha-ketoglutarate-dependent taurine dioxygenase